MQASKVAALLFSWQCLNYVSYGCCWFTYLCTTAPKRTNSLQTLVKVVQIRANEETGMLYNTVRKERAVKGLLTGSTVI